MNAPAKIRLHGVSLPFAPIAADDPAPRKTPLEAYQESRIPLGGALQGRDTRTPTTEPPREALAMDRIVEIVCKGPTTAAIIAREMGLPVERMSTALRNLRKAGRVAMVDRKGKGQPNIWHQPGYVFPEKTEASGRNFAKARAMRTKKATARRDDCAARVIELLRDGPMARAEIQQHFDLSRSALNVLLTSMTDEGTLSRRMPDGRGKQYVYEVAQ